MIDDNTTSGLEKLAAGYLHEQRRRRFWSIFFKIMFLLIFASFFVITLPIARVETMGLDKPHVAFIDVSGEISDNAEASADNIATALHRAYKNKGTKGVILRINSPGGSPVQADYIFNEIKRWKKNKPDIPVYAVCVDICASAAYYIAAASDNIYANEASIVGSIGVLYNGFGFSHLIDKLGIERRLMISGSNKAVLDPFSPVKASDKKHMQKMLDTVHDRFIQRVREGRGARIKESAEIYSGLFWSGVEAKSLGLIDDFASTGHVARDIIGVDKIIDYTEKPNVLDRITKQFGAEMKQRIGALFQLKPLG